MSGRSRGLHGSRLQWIHVLIATLILSQGCAGPAKRYHRFEPLPTTPRWTSLDSEFDRDVGAVILRDNHIVELEWNSAALDDEVTHYSQLVIAVLDARHARDVKNWIIDETPDMALESLDVRVILPNGAVFDLPQTSIVRERTRDGRYRRRFEVPHFGDRILLEVSRKEYCPANRPRRDRTHTTVPYFEIPVQHELPCRRFDLTFCLPGTAIGQTSFTPLQESLARSRRRWRVCGPDRQEPSVSCRAGVVSRTWTLSDIPARARSELADEGHHFVVGIDAFDSENPDIYRNYHTRAFRSRRGSALRAESMLDAEALRRAPASQRVDAVQAWMRDNFSVIPGPVYAGSEPRSWSQILESRTGDASELNALASSLLDELGVDHYPVVSEHRPGCPIVVPYFEQVCLLIRLPDGSDVVDFSNPDAGRDRASTDFSGREGVLLTEQGHRPVWMGR